MTAYPTNRWRGVVAVGLVASAIGLVADRTDLVLLAVVAVVFAAYPRLTSPPDPDLEIERRLSERSPAPGESVRVEVTIRNAGDRTLPDLRVVDGVPAALSVVDGSPRCGMALRPGGDDQFSYVVEAEAGTHSFEPATVVARDVAGAWEAETTVAVDTEIDCTGDVEGDAHRNLTREQVGRVLSDEGGTGTEFHYTREYRRGDAMGRIDWNRYARAGELTTVEYRQERAASVVLLVDAREAAYRAAAGRPHAVAHSVSAARLLLESLLDRRDFVGVSAFGRGDCWLTPDAGPEHRTRARQLFSTHGAFAVHPPRPDEGDPLSTQVKRLRTRLPDATQVLLLSPLTDDAIVRASRRLEAHGHLVTVVSPDVTSEGTVGQRLAGVERANRIDQLRRAEIPVVDWDCETPLGSALEDAIVVGRGTA